MKLRTPSLNPKTGLPEQPLTIKVSERIESLQPWEAYGLAYGGMIGLMVLDHFLGYALSLSRLLILPVSLLTWSQGRHAGVSIATIGIFFWAISPAMQWVFTASPMIGMWSVALRWTVLVACAYILAALHEAWQQEKLLARTDFLTGVANRRFFMELANQEIRRAKRYQRPFIVAYIDVDDFKMVNDRFGHNQGDSLLRLVAQTIQASLRDTDLVARLGGDEFVVLLPETASASAEDVITKIHHRLAAAMVENKWSVTFSIGAMSYPVPPVSVDEMIKSADQLMYTSKHRGKNSIHYDVFAPKRLP